MTMQTMSEMKAQIRDRATEDEDFRAQLIADPKSVISAELGIFIPEEFNVEVHEESGTTAHLILPPSQRLTEEDLAQVSGAHYAPGGHGNNPVPN